MQLGAFGVLLASAVSCLAARSLPIGELRNGLLLQKAPAADDVDPTTLYPAYNFSVPIDHFHNESRYEPHSNGTFNIRYWFDASYYKPGGPVLVLCSGEDSGDDRLPYLQKGIIYQLAKATGGVGVVLEHRYYGSSFPVPDLSTESLRFLTTDQSLADTTYFANNIVFPGLENETLTAKDTPYIAYGGSYAGAYVSFLRKLYPETWWGAISSSGVTNAQWDYHQYFDPIVQYGPQPCINLTQSLTHVMDNIIFTNHNYVAELKQLFNLQGLKYDDDFMSALSYGVTYWQSRNWDPAVNDPDFANYCGNISSVEIEYPAYKNREALAEKLITAGGYANEASAWAPHLLNWAAWMNYTQIQPILQSGETVSQYFTNHNKTFFEQDDITQTWRSWPYQYCTQWGYLQVGSTVPKDQLPLVSRTQTLEYASTICRDAFNITVPAKTEEINKYGGFTISYPRLAQIGGQTDPWRPTSPLADPYLNKPSTQSEPRILIQGAVHHWDENGLFPNETTATLPPAPIVQAQAQEAAFVKEWLSEWHARRV